MHAIVVLGCRLGSRRPAAGGGTLAGTLGRRLALAAETYKRDPESTVIASGGRVWGGIVEADAMRDELCRLGVPAERIVRERCSHTTRENALFTSKLLARLGIDRAKVVTCDWHAPRASAHFRRCGVAVEIVAAPLPHASWTRRTWFWGRERVAGWLGLFFAAFALAGCPKPTAAIADAGEDAGIAPELTILLEAEDRRRSAEVTDAFRTSHDVRLRRASARALARIADADAESGLFRALTDEDPETVGWGAYGLGFSCKGKEDAHVRALAARAASFDPLGGEEGGAPARDFIDPRAALARAVGRCGGTLAEQVLLAWIRGQGPMAGPAVIGLGDVARSRGSMSDEAAGVLLDAAEASQVGSQASLACLYPFGRIEQVGEAWAPRVIELAKKDLATPSELRSFAIRALSRAGRGAAAELSRVAQSRDFTATERAEAGRGLSLLGEAGRAAAGVAISRLAPDKDPFAIQALAGDELGVMLALIQSLGGEAPKEGLAGLRALSVLSAPGTVPPMLARRIAAVRCEAAAALANGAYDAEVLTKCDPSGSELEDRARLATLLRRPLVGERRAIWILYTKSPHVRVREAALEAITRHPELGDAARVALAEALASPAPGVVATATDIVEAHPDRVMVLAAREIRNATDPRAPPPTTNPSKETDHAVAAALTTALGHAWPEDLVETRVGLLDAAAAVHLPMAHDAAAKACQDPNATVREHAQKDLRALGDISLACAAPANAQRSGGDAGDGGEPDRGIPVLLTHPVKVVLETDAGELSILFEPDLAPLAAARFIALARKGFYRGVLVHRVVPGFVAQFGDPGGDGYGGAGSLLRCETSPVPFGPLDVGVALSGRDTGSSQLFVTLGRYPHLDGEYARVGHAQGDWVAVTDGDVIHEVKVED